MDYDYSGKGSVRATYDNMPDLIRWFIPFTHGSCRGENDGDTYTVYSYATRIFQADTTTREVLYFDSTYYSRTTSRLQNIIRRVFDIS